MREKETAKVCHGTTHAGDGMEEAQRVRLKNSKILRLRRRALRRGALRRGALAAGLCLAAGLGALFLLGRTGGDRDVDNFWGDGDHTLLEVHREDFTPGLPPEAETAFAGVPGVMKTYRTLYNQWFLAEELTDFSQALGTEEYYIVPGYSHGLEEPPQEGSYGVYTLDEDGRPCWGMGTGVPANRVVPYGFCRLTDDIIREDLAGIEYEDIIIAHSALLYTVFVWARCPGGEDRFVTYCTIPEFVHLENRGRYTLEEIREILTEAYEGS